jgi:pyruvate/2-oxoglutarate dehydrogenase complex dihydrolipoamide acyltransferase (E2) component
LVLAFDHRVLDAAKAGCFERVVIDALKAPAKLLLAI